jgi:hypothetical protein
MFRLYGLATDGRAEMNKTMFQEFCVRVNITDNSEARTRPAGMGRVHLRANIDHAQPNGGPWIDFFDRQFMHPKSLRAERERIESEASQNAKAAAAHNDSMDHSLSVKEFIAALVRCAHAKYHNVPGLYHRWLHLIEQNLPNIEQLNEIIKDEVTQVMQWPAVQDLFVRHHNTLELLFLHFSKSDRSERQRGADESMNMTEFASCLKQAHVLGDALTELEVKQIFAAANLDDDLFGPSACMLPTHSPACPLARTLPAADNSLLTLTM